MWNFLKSIFMVTLVTIVIWVFAESESLRPAEVRAVEITVLPAGATYTLDLDQGPGVRGNIVRADITLEGPTAALDVVQRLLRNPITISPGVEGFSSEPARHTVDLQTVLRNQPDLHLASRGVTIKCVSPETIEATIDKLVTRTVKIDVEVPGAELDGPPEV